MTYHKDDVWYTGCVIWREERLLFYFHFKYFDSHNRKLWIFALGTWRNPADSN